MSRQPEESVSDVRSMVMTNLRWSMTEAQKNNDIEKQEHERLKKRRKRSEAIFQQERQKNDWEKQDYEQQKRERERREVLYQDAQQIRWKQLEEHSVHDPLVRTI